MTANNNQTIIIQVGGKIAAEIIPVTDDINLNISNWSIAFDAVVDALFEKMGIVADAGTPAVMTPDEIVAAFGGALLVQPNYAPAPQYATGGTVRVKGTQHGPLPAWLESEAAKKGITEVWDNRDGLAVNAKRPWFKSTAQGGAGIWEPKARK